MTHDYQFTDYRVSVDVLGKTWLSNENKSMHLQHSVGDTTQSWIDLRLLNVMMMEHANR